MSEAFRSDRSDEPTYPALDAPTAAQPIRDLTLGGGRFQVTRRLGIGAFGVVYEAFDSARAATVAIKRVRAVDVASIYDVKKEFRVLADLMHPNLVTLYDLFADGDDWFIVMELVPRCRLPHLRPPARVGGATVRRRQPLRSARPTGRCSSEPSSQLVRAVCYLHERGKLHRESKPTNVLVTADGVLKVLDFGLTTDGGAGRDGRLVSAFAVRRPTWRRSRRRAVRRPRRATGIASASCCSRR